MVLQLRTSIDGEGASKSDSDSLRAKLKFIEDCVYQGTQDVVTDTLIKEYIDEFERGKNKASLYANMKSAALAETGAGRGVGRGAGEEGAKSRWRKGQRRSFNESLAGPRCVGFDESPHGSPTSKHVSRAFLVKKPGENKWRLVFDFKWMYSFCVKSKVKMKTLKKLRQLAEPNDWCFSFDLQDGYHVVGIDPDFQKYMQFDLQGHLFQCTALPFGWLDSPRIFPKFMKVMVEAFRLPGAAENRRELPKLKNKRVTTPRYEERRRAGGVHRDLRRRGARVLTYMDDFLILASTEEEAFVQRERVQRVLARLGFSRNKKGQWEPGQLIEHLGLEVDLKEGLFRVTEKRIDKIHTHAKSIICDAAGEKRWQSARCLEAFNGLCQTVYLAVPAARLYLCNLHFVLTTKRS
ncbi:hypothetical protein CYMTET_34663 [Cymbomonas tetramitiformis]|uniref:Reverse transcriptase domain-containing protein n=1 Tax=Cymbomonas tetramitiformis TaxID=36881 RepID=A0AAE0KPR0_9CHLO|nr:hypothetical protein CYMTET_34663 [Cymbomonas tetramitiformis]